MSKSLPLPRFAGAEYRLLALILLAWLSCLPTFAQRGPQPGTNRARLLELAETWRAEYAARRAVDVPLAREQGLPLRIEEDGRLAEFQYFDERGIPIYYQTDNLDAAISNSALAVHPGGGAGLNLTGAGITIGEWDGGSARSTHQEFDGRVTIEDGGGINFHATHVAGTMVASGVNIEAKGMAPEADLLSYDWNSDNSEMASEAAEGLLFSNHSYGQVRGWRFSNGDWYWYGDPSISETEDYRFGFYNGDSYAWDLISQNAPYYLIVKSGGNERNNNGPGPGGTHFVRQGSQWVQSNVTRDPDGLYDCVGAQGISKNILTVAATQDVLNYTGGNSVGMSSFSSWGPADDGRIKPDIAANGVGLLSTWHTADDDYSSISGTSMSAPSVTGALALLQQHYSDLNEGLFLRASSLKGLVIHTANEAGNTPGPDYRFGWGLMNTRRAAEFISQIGNGQVFVEDTLVQGATYTTTVTTDGSAPVVVTLSWTDVPGQPLAPALNPTTPVLVNDLDVRLISEDSTYLPYVLDPANVTAAATHGDNVVDNVEQIYLSELPAGTYTVQVTHKGTLAEGPQVFSLLAGTETPFESITIEPPVITSFSPSAGSAGTVVTIQGLNLSGAASVRFNGAAATFTVDSDTVITATVPEGATTGPIAVTNAFATDVSSNEFVVLPPFCTSLTVENGQIFPSPEWSTRVAEAGSAQYWSFETQAGGMYSFSTCGAGISTALRIYDGDGELAGSIGGGPYCEGTAASLDWVAPKSSTYVVLLSGTSCEPLSEEVTLAFRAQAPPPFCEDNAAGQGTLTFSPDWERVTAMPGASRFWTFEAVAGNTYAFSTCGSTQSTQIQVYSQTEQLGFGLFTNPNCDRDEDAFVWTCDTSGTYYVLLLRFLCNSLLSEIDMDYRQVVAPIITSFTPDTGPVGATVEISGSNLGSATEVRFNGTAATEFTVNSDSSVTATVPTGATTGPISVLTPLGEGTSGVDFTVDTQTSLAGATTRRLTVHPNPAAGAFTVQLSGAWRGTVLYTLTDVLGREVYRATGRSDRHAVAEDLPAGVYYLRAQDAHHAETQRLVIRR